MEKLILGDTLKKKKKLKRKDNILVVIIIFLSIFSYFELNGDIRVGNILNDLLYIPTRLITEDELKITLEEELINENDELKSLLNINYSLTDFTIINGTVIERNSSFWLNEITINKGLLDGINKKDSVISKNGLIGEISSVSLFSSKIKLITSNDYKISVTINKINKILSTDNNHIIIRGINEKDKIKIGDKVVTSGLQGKYPKGILIGRIKDLRYEDNNVGIIADIELATDINDLSFVSVLKRKIK